MNQDSNNKVLNMEEVKDTAQKEKKSSKRGPLLLMFAGIFAIVMGFLYPYINEMILGDSGVNKESGSLNDQNAGTGEENLSSVSSLSCVKETTDEVQQITYTDTLTYTFTGGTLTNYTDSFNLKPIEGSTNGVTNFTTLANNYETEKALFTGIAGITIDSALDTTLNTYTLNMITDLTTYDVATAPQTTLIKVNQVVNTLYNDVKTTMEASEYTCE